MSPLQQFNHQDVVRFSRRGFSLIELLAVMAIISILLVAAGPAIGTIGKSQGITQAASDIPDFLSQARAYAMAQNTYVYVGFFEADGSQPEGKHPQSAGLGRLFLVAAATNDGTNGLQNGGFPGDSELTSLSRIVTLNGVSMTSVSTVKKNVDGLAADSNIVDLKGSSSATPLKSSDIKVGNAISEFDKVIQFSPSGTARIVKSAGDNSIPSYIQIGFQPANGGKVAENSKNVFAVQVDGITGATRVLRPQL